MTALATGAPARAAIARHTSDGEHDGTYPLRWAIALHLLPGMALGSFLLVAVPRAERHGIDPLFAMFGGIGLVIVPLELGVLALHAHRTRGTWSPLAAVHHRPTLPRRRLLATAAKLALWFLAVLVISIAVVDGWAAENVFGWLPDAIHHFSEIDDSAQLSGRALASLLVVAFVCNGIAGPVTEELYFRGHLLPRMRTLGNRAPVVHTVLFALYHAWTPWRWPAILVGFLPISRRTAQTGDLRLSILSHVSINVTFLLLLLGSYLGS